jgi:PAS domain S-box-containing protein
MGASEAIPGDTLTIGPLDAIEASFRATFDLAPIGIAHIGINGRFLLVNQALCNILGYEREALTALTVKDVSHPDDADLADPQRLRLHAGELEVMHLEKRFIERGGRIELEITESQLMRDPEHAIRVMRNLRDAGLRISVDDFGTGYSSLAYLRQLPISSLKIDRSFVRDVHENESDATIVRAIIDLAHNLQFSVIAEGVETDAQATLLRRYGCELAQGYLFGRPVPADEVVERLARHAAAPAA